jgi:hypothetical protein
MDEADRMERRHDFCYDMSWSKLMIYTVYNNSGKRKVSADSKADAARIFLREKASDKPRRLGEQPACFVNELDGDATPFWRASSEVWEIIQELNSRE